MTPRADSQFLARLCALDAAAQGASLGDKAKLFSAWLSGKPSPRGLVDFTANALLTPSLRTRLLEAVDGVRGMRQKHSK